MKRFNKSLLEMVMGLVDSRERFLRSSEMETRNSARAIWRCAIGVVLLLLVLEAGGWITAARQAETSRRDNLCAASGKDKIELNCGYKEMEAVDRQETQIVLNHVLISFAPKDESHMTIELTLTNRGPSRYPTGRPVYLGIDDDDGRNNVRRLLSRVELWRVGIGETSTFSDHLLVGAFRPGHYTVYLWIPSSKPALKFKAGENFLLSSEGVADPRTGL